MKIAQVAPLSECVPPERYGGTERVVSYLTEELVRRGHEVTLFASGDSRTSARLVSPCPVALWRNDAYELPEVYHTILLEQVARDLDQFDVVHFHLDHWHLPLMSRSGVPYVTTLHGRLDLEDLVPLFATFPEAPVISISDAQRKPLPHANWVRTIHHGLPVDLLSYNATPDDYVAFIGRTSPEKGLSKAIDIAIAANMKLKISAAVQPVNRAYFDAEIAPRLSHPLIEFVGEVGGSEKEAFLQNARALLFPINWPEPFGLVMIEAMACGTPVIAFPNGSVPEVLHDGVTGFVVPDVASAVEATRSIDQLDRRAIRDEFERRFTVRRMVDEHEQVYAQLAAPGVGAGSTESPRGSRSQRSEDLPALEADDVPLPVALDGGIARPAAAHNGHSSQGE